MAIETRLKCVLALAVVVAFVILITSSQVLKTNVVISTGTTNYKDCIPAAESKYVDGSKTAMDSKLVVDKLRSRYLVPPPPANTPLKLDHPGIRDPSSGQAAVIRKLLNDQRDGFFIECGGADGEFLSNSLMMERDLNWTGLLIEAAPKNLDILVTRGRNVYLSPTCLSSKPYPIVASFLQDHRDRYHSKISKENPGFNETNHFDVQCFPLFSYLLALERTTIDYFSLDIEGLELEVLETIPWDKVNIRTLSVEYVLGSRKKEEIRKFMEGKGYTTWGEVTIHWAKDYIFYKL